LQGLYPCCFNRDLRRLHRLFGADWFDPPVRPERQPLCHGFLMTVRIIGATLRDLSYIAANLAAISRIDALGLLHDLPV
jgi:hypothetical protein